MPASNLLDDMRAVMAQLGQDWAWSDTAAPLLADMRPAAYGDWTPEKLGRELAARGCPTRPLNRVDPGDGRRRNRQGVTVDDLDEAGRDS